MKWFLLLAFAVIMGFILVNRERVYVRDPLATVYRNQAEQHGVEVYINYSNDVLLLKGGDRPYRLVVQNWDHAAGTPVKLSCIHWMACLADEDHASIVPLTHPGTGEPDADVVMSSREVLFTDADGSRVRVALR